MSNKIVALETLEKIVTKISILLATKSDTNHTHNASDIEGVVTSVNNVTPDTDGNITLDIATTWDDIDNKPNTFTPESHTHSISEVRTLETVLSKKANTSTVIEMQDALMLEINDRADKNHTHDELTLEPYPNLFDKDSTENLLNKNMDYDTGEVQDSNLSHVSHKIPIDYKKVYELKFWGEQSPIVVPFKTDDTPCGDYYSYGYDETVRLNFSELEEASYVRIEYYSDEECVHNWEFREAKLIPIAHEAWTMAEDSYDIAKLNSNDIKNIQGQLVNFGGRNLIPCTSFDNKDAKNLDYLTLSNTANGKLSIENGWLVYTAKTTEATNITFPNIVHNITTGTFIFSMEYYYVGTNGTTGAKLSVKLNGVEKGKLGTGETRDFSFISGITPKTTPTEITSSRKFVNGVYDSAECDKFNNLRLEVTPNYAGDKFYFRHVQLEEGSIPTSWTPSYEDTINQGWANHAYDGSLWRIRSVNNETKQIVIHDDDAKRNTISVGNDILIIRGNTAPIVENIKVTAVTSDKKTITVETTETLTNAWEYIVRPQDVGNRYDGSAHAEGWNTIAVQASSHAEGMETVATGYGSHAEGVETLATGYGSHAEGVETLALAYASHAEGCVGIANGTYSHVEGYYSRSNGESSHAEGERTIANNTASHAEGLATQSFGIGSHSEGIITLAYSGASHAEGNKTVAMDGYLYTITAYDNSTKTLTFDANDPLDELSVGDIITITESAGYSPIVDGVKITNINGNVVKIETTEYISKKCRYAVIPKSTADTDDSAPHAEGKETFAIGKSSHAEGYATKAKGDYSHARGCGTVANGEAQTVLGKYNVADTTSAVIVGNGTDKNRQNIHMLDWDGGAWFANNVTVGADKKELATKEYVDELFKSIVGEGYINGDEVDY